MSDLPEDPTLWPSFERMFEQMGYFIDHGLNGDMEASDVRLGFVLIVFPQIESGQCKVMSNVLERREVVGLMRELVRRYDSGTMTMRDIPGGRIQ